MFEGRAHMDIMTAAGWRGTAVAACVETQFVLGSRPRQALSAGPKGPKSKGSLRFDFAL
jgi:hypothetical protein